MPSVRLSPRLAGVIRTAAAVALCIGATAIAGWILDAPLLTRGLPGLATMKANTGVAAILGGVGLWAATRAGRPSRHVTVAAGLLLLGLGLVSLLQNVTGRDAGIDEWLVPDLLTVPPDAPGRTAPASATMALLLGAALALHHTSRWALEQALAATVLVLSAFALIGTVYGAIDLYRIPPFATVSVLTSCAFFLLAAGLVLARGNSGIAQMLLSGRPGAVLARQLWLPTAALVIALGAVLEFVQARGSIGPRVDSALFALSVLAVTSLLFWATGRRLNRLDEGLRESTRLYRCLSECNQAIVRADAGDERTVLGEVCRTLVGTGGFAAAWIARSEGDTAPALVASRGGCAGIPLAVATALRSGLTSADHDEPCPALACPVPVSEGTAVAVGVRLPEPREFTGPEIQLLEQVAADLSSGLRRLAAEERARVSHARFQGILASAMDAVVSVDARQRIVLFNQAAERMFGRQARDVLGEPLALLVPARHLEVFGGAGPGSGDGSPAASPTTLSGVRSSGDAFPIEASISRLTVAGDVVTTAVLRDTTERRQAQAELHEREERFRQIAHLVPQLIWTTDAHGRTEFTGDQWRTFTGQDGMEVARGGWEAIFDPGDYAVMQERWQEVQRTLRPFQGAGRIRRHDGVYRWFDVRARPVLDEEGRLLKWIGANTEIHEEREAREALRASEERLAFALEVGQSAPWSLDLQTLAIEGSALYFRLLGYDAPVENWTLQRFMEHVLPEDRQAIETGFGQLVRQGGEGYLDFRVHRRDGAIRWLSGRTRQHRPADPARSPLTGVVQDVTDRKHIEEEVRRLNVTLEERVRARTEQLEAANRELEAFSYSVSHDLRAPLRAVDGFAQAVIEDYGGHLPEEGQRYLRRVREGAQRMGTLVDDLLGFSRLGRQALRRGPVSMRQIVHDCLEELEALDTRPGLDITVGDLPPAFADEALIRQVWINLIVNALKFSRTRPDARVEISSTAEGGEVAYFVRDNGVGFDMQYADKLFGVFQRLHRGEDFEGTGVGLAIVQRIVHRHGGSVRAESAPGRGATFFFSLKPEADS